MTIDLICLGDGDAPKREELNGISVLRLPINHRRGNKLSYVYNYAVFIFISALVLAVRAFRRRYDLVYINNMPDILVVSSLVPKALGAKVLLDLHDPMPELTTTIFSLGKEALWVRVIQGLEKWSIARATSVVTVNDACKRVFASRSCRAEKITVVMNSPDEQIFPLRTPCTHPPTSCAARPFVVMYHGTIVERNGLDLAVDAVARVHESVPDVELRIYGRKTPFLEQVIGEAHDKGVGHSVRYLGPKRLEELVREIEECDLGIIPSHRSAFADMCVPTRIFEYLALGKPVIAPRTPGIEAYFSPESLLFFESGNSDELARQIEFAASCYNETRAIAQRGQSVYLAHTWAQEKEKLMDVVAQLLDGGRSYG
jgi:glycosyltransferase involved in cell wall biosynthesis